MMEEACSVCLILPCMAEGSDESLVPLLLERLQSSGSMKKEDIKYVTHRV